MFELISREPKYRVKRLDDARWSTGMFASVEHNNIICPAIYRVHESDIGDWVSYDLIEPGTLCESSHLRDSDGVEIFEGDIIEITLNDNYMDAKYYVKNRRWVGVCVFEGGSFRVSSSSTKDWDGTHFDLYTYTKDRTGDKFKTKVIGNIFDNPEMVKGEYV